MSKPLYFTKADEKLIPPDKRALYRAGILSKEDIDAYLGESLKQQATEVEQRKQTNLAAPEEKEAPWGGQETDITDYISTTDEITRLNDQFAEARAEDQRLSYLEGIATDPEGANRRLEQLRANAFDRSIGNMYAKFQEDVDEANRLWQSGELWDRRNAAFAKQQEANDLLKQAEFKIQNYEKLFKSKGEYGRRLLADLGSNKESLYPLAGGIVGGAIVGYFSAGTGTSAGATIGSTIGSIPIYDKAYNAAYVSAVRGGVPESEAQTFAAAMAGSEAFIEAVAGRFGAGGSTTRQILKDSLYKRFGKKVAAAGLSEGIEELAAGRTQEAIGAGILSSEGTSEELKKQVAGEIPFKKDGTVDWQSYFGKMGREFSTGLAGGTVVGGLGAPVAIKAENKQVAERVSAARTALNNIRTSLIEQGVTGTELTNRLAQEATNISAAVGADAKDIFKSEDLLPDTTEVDQRIKEKVAGSLVENVRLRPEDPFTVGQMQAMQNIDLEKPFQKGGLKTSYKPLQATEALYEEPTTVEEGSFNVGVPVQPQTGFGVQPTTNLTERFESPQPQVTPTIGKTRVNLTAKIADMKATDQRVTTPESKVTPVTKQPKVTQITATEGLSSPKRMAQENIFGLIQKTAAKEGNLSKNQQKALQNQQRNIQDATDEAERQLNFEDAFQGMTQDQQEGAIRRKALEFLSSGKKISDISSEFDTKTESVPSARQAQVQQAEQFLTRSDETRNRIAKDVGSPELVDALIRDRRITVAPTFEGKIVGGKPADNAQAFVVDGDKIVVNASKLGAKDAKEQLAYAVVAHEYSHKKERTKDRIPLLKQLEGEKAYGELNKSIADLSNKSGRLGDVARSAMRRAQDAVDGGYASDITQEVPQYFVEELLTSYDGPLGAVRKYVDGAISAVRNAATKLGVPLNVRPQDLAYIIKQDIVQEAKGKGKKGEPDFSKPVNFSYAGEKSAVADKGTLQKAKDMLNAGKSMEDIRSETGWFLNQWDNAWRFEVSDKDAKLKVAFKDIPESELLGETKTLLLKEVLDHPTLFENYPELENVEFIKRIGFFDFGTLQGWYNDEENRIGITPYAKDPLGTLLHEIQHWIQGVEGFGLGGNESSAFASLPNEAKATLATDALKQTETSLESDISARDAYTTTLNNRDLLALAEEALSLRDNRDLPFLEKLSAVNQISNRVKSVLGEGFGANEVVKYMHYGFHKDMDGFKQDFERRAAQATESAAKNTKTLAAIKSGDTAALLEVLKRTGKAYKFYRSLLGEIEARDVTNRKDLDVGDRVVTPPYEKTMIEDSINPSDVIVVKEPQKGRVNFSLGTKEATGFKEAKQQGKTFTSPVTGEEIFEIPDTDMKVNAGIIRAAKGKPIALEMALVHDELFKQWPFLRKDVKIKLSDKFALNEAEYEPTTKTITISDQNIENIYNSALSSEARKEARKDIAKTVLHEVTHAIQDKIGAEMGSNPKFEMYAYILNKLNRTPDAKVAAEYSRVLNAVIRNKKGVDKLFDAISKLREQWEAKGKKWPETYTDLDIHIANDPALAGQIMPFVKGLGLKSLKDLHETYNFIRQAKNAGYFSYMANRGEVTARAVALVFDGKFDTLQQAEEAVAKQFNALGTQKDSKATFAEFEKQTKEGKIKPETLFSIAPTTRPDVFYSAIAEAVSRAQGAPKRANATQWKQWLDGAIRRGEFKQSERDWIGVDAWLDSRETTTREELADFVRANEVQVQHVVLGGEQVLRDADGRPMDDGAGGVVTRGSATKYDSYRTPGGENYRELLLTLPRKKTANELYDQHNNFLHAMHAKYGDGWLNKASADDLAENTRLARAAEAADGVMQNYTSGHWDQPNVLAHVRFDERTDADGKRVLFVQEIQSDWHQEGRKKGYKGAVSDSDAMAWANLSPEQWGRATEYQREQARRGAGDTGVPNAPLKATDEWAMLAFKRMARWAVDNGFDRIAWTTGEMAADVFDLSKQISRVEYTSNGVLLAHGPQGDLVISQTVPEENLPDYIGKDVAEKLLAQEPHIPRSLSGAAGPSRVLEGQDIKVGGEGMRGFYDRILPAAVNKWAKKFGAKVGESVLDLPAPKAGDVVRGGVVVGPEKTPDLVDKLVAVHAIDITPQMREAVAEGQPLFSIADNNFSNTAKRTAAAVTTGLVPAKAKILVEQTIGVQKLYEAKMNYNIRKLHELANRNGMDWAVIEAGWDRMNKQKTLRANTGNKDVDAALGVIRTQIDDMSRQFKTLFSNAGVPLPKRLDDIITNNQGQYISRSYEIDYNKDYGKEYLAATKNDPKKKADLDNLIKFFNNGMSRDLMRAATLTDDQVKDLWDKVIGSGSTTVDEKRADLVNFAGNRKMTEITDALVNDVLRIGKGGRLAGFYRGASRDTSILKSKRDIPAEIRKVWGERTGVAEAAMTTVIRLARLLAETQMQADLLKRAPESFSDKATTELSERISPSTDKYGPLAGKYTTPEMKRFLEMRAEQYESDDALLFDVHSVATQDRAVANAAANVLRQWRKGIGAFKAYTVLGEPINYTLNLLGMMQAVGFKAPKDWSYTDSKGNKLSFTNWAGQFSKDLALGEVGPETTELYQQMVKYGLIGSALAGDIQEAFVRELRGNKSWTKTTWEKAGHVANVAFGGPEIFSTGVVFANESNFLRELWTAQGKKFTFDELMQEAADRTKNSTISRDRAFRFAKVGDAYGPSTYFTFFSETIRAPVTNLLMAYKLMKEARTMNPAAAKIANAYAIRQFIAFPATVAASYAMVEMLSYLLGSDFGSDEDEVPEALPEGMRSNVSNLVVLGETSAGEKMVYDASMANTYSALMNPLAQIAKGNFTNAAEEILGLQFVNPLIRQAVKASSGELGPSESRVPAAANEAIAWMGLNEYIPPEIVSRAPKMLAGAEPSFVIPVYDLLSGKKSPDDFGGGIGAFMSLMGARPYVYSPQRAATFKINEVSDQYKEAVSNLNEVMRNRNSGKETVRAAVDRFYDEEYRIIQEAIPVFKAARAGGMNPEIMQQLMAPSGLKKSVRQALLTGNYQPTVQARNWLEISALSKIIQKPRKEQEEILEGYRRNRQLFDEVFQQKFGKKE